THEICGLGPPLVTLNILKATPDYAEKAPFIKGVSIICYVCKLLDKYQTSGLTTWPPHRGRIKALFDIFCGITTFICC
ncbi:MAG: hypothetical protein KAS94_09050, partial [Desulfobulbaceae bacterium]|nr:hypothetical protein [Desulfobulbaceae bacterium]